MCLEPGRSVHTNRNKHLWLLERSYMNSWLAPSLQLLRPGWAAVPRWPPAQVQAEAAKSYLPLLRELYVRLMPVAT